MVSVGQRRLRLFQVEETEGGSGVVHGGRFVVILGREIGGRFNAWIFPVEETEEGAWIFLHGAMVEESEGGSLHGSSRLKKRKEVHGFSWSRSRREGAR